MSHLKKKLKWAKATVAGLQKKIKQWEEVEKREEKSKKKSKK